VYFSAKSLDKIDDLERFKRNPRIVGKYGIPKADSFGTRMKK